MRRWIWLLGLLVVGIAGTVWWSSRNAVRLEPLDAQRFAQMSETEQVEWLIEQVLARSKRTDTITTLLEKLPFVRQSAVRPIAYWEIEAIGTACVEYDLPHWLSRSHRYAETESYREHLRVYQAILQARKGDWRAAEQTVQQIRTDPIKAFARAHLGRLYAEAGRSDAAQQSFDQATALLTRPSEPVYHFYQATALALVARYSSLPDRPEAVAPFIGSLPEDLRRVAFWEMSNAYRRRGDAEPIRELIRIAPPSERRAMQAQLVRTLIEQGQVEAGLKELARVGKWEDYQIVRIARALHRQGRTQDARTFADALRTPLLQHATAKGRLPVRISDSIRVSTPYGEVEVVFKSSYNTIFLLTRAYTEWGLPDQAERLIAAMTPESSLRQRLNLAYAHYTIGQQAQARQHLERTIASTQQAASSGAWQAANRTQLMHPLGLSMEVGCAAAFCGEPALALEVADTIPLSEQRSILLCILRDHTYRRNAFWKELLTIPWD
jgi:tetratricopeptide (TPR) repeat protein